MIPIDNYDKFPSGMKEYLSHYGFHFSKNACDFAINNMRKVEEGTDKKKKIQIKEKSEIDKILETHGQTPENNKGYDAVFVYHMAKADYPKSLPDEQHVATYVKETLDDPDASPETTFRRWLATMVGNGEPIIWEDML